jgi:hypothetical protein
MSQQPELEPHSSCSLSLLAIWNLDDFQSRERANTFYKQESQGLIGSIKFQYLGL